MASLKSLSKYINGQAGADLMRAIFNNSMFLTWLESVGGWELDATDFDWLNVGGTADLRNIAESGTWGEFSAINSTARKTGSQAIYYDGFTVSSMRNIDQDRGLRQQDNWIYKTRLAKHRAFARALEKAVFVDDGTSNKMVGITKRLDGTRLIGYEDTNLWTDDEAKRKFNAAKKAKSPTAKTMDLTDEANFDGFIELMYEAKAKMDNLKGIVIPDALRPRLTTILRKTGLLTPNQNYEREIVNFDGTPIISVPNSVIPQNEPDDTATPLTNTTSMYFLSPEEQRFSIVTNSGLWYNEYNHRENKYQDKEMYGINMQTKIEDNKAVLRVHNIKVA